MQAFESLFRVAIMTWVLDSVSLGVGVECLEPDINAHLLAGWEMGDLAGSTDTELAIIAVSTAHNANPFDLFEREGFDLLIAYQAKAINPTTIGEANVFAIVF